MPYKGVYGEVAILLSSSQPCTGLSILIIAYIAILGPYKYSFMYDTCHVTSPRLSNKSGYMILIGTPTQHPTPDYQPLAVKPPAILTSLTQYSIYIYIMSNWSYIDSCAVSNSDPPFPLTPSTKIHVHASGFQGSIYKLFQTSYSESIHAI